MRDLWVGGGVGAHSVHPGGVKRELALSTLAGEVGAAGGGLVPLPVQFRIAEVVYAQCTWAVGK